MKTHFIGIDISKQTLDWAVKGAELSGQANSLTGHGFVAEGRQSRY